MLLDFLSLEFNSAPAIVPDTHDVGYDHKAYKAWLKHQKKINESFKSREQEKILRIQELREQIQLSAKPKQIAHSVFENKTTAKELKHHVQQNNTKQLKDELELMQKQLVLIVEQSKIAALEYRKRKDEKDIQAILMLLSF